MDEYLKGIQAKTNNNARFIEIVKLLGLEATYFAGMYTVRTEKGEYIGQMTAEAWLDHLRNCMIKANRS